MITKSFIYGITNLNFFSSVMIWKGWPYHTILVLHTSFHPRFVCNKLMKKTMVWNSVWWLSLFCENCGFQFLRQVLRIALVLLHFKKKRISHSENQPGFQNLEKNLVRWFSGLPCRTNFWTSSFQARFSQVNSHKSKFFVCDILLLSFSGVLLFSFLFFSFFGVSFLFLFLNGKWKIWLPPQTNIISFQWSRIKANLQIKEMQC